MGISLEQYRARIGTFSARGCKSKDVSDPIVLDGLSDLDTSSPIMISLNWKASSLGLLLIVLCAICQNELLLMGGVESNPGPTSEETNDKRASVIAELIVKAESQTVKDVIRLYKPVMTQEQLQTAFKGPRKELIIETLTYLGVPGCQRFFKDATITKLISRIQNFFPDQCAECSQEYTVTLGEAELLKCSICEQGIHSRCLAQKLGIAEIDLDQMTTEDVWNRVNPCGLTTLTYLCGYCHTAEIPAPDNGLKKHKKDTTKPVENPEAGPNLGVIDLSNTDPSDRLLTQPSSGPQDTDLSKSTSRDASEADDESESDYEPVNIITRQRRLTKTKDQGRKPTVDKPEPVGEKPKPICPYYRKGQCRYGISGKGCSKSHPSLCRKLMTNGNKHPHGCTKGKECDKFHPKMCPSSIAHSECLNDTCSLYHVKGTRRRNSTQPHLVPKRGDRSRITNENHAKPQEQSQQNIEDSFLEILDKWRRELMNTIDQRFLVIDQRMARPAGPQVSHAAPPTAPHFPYPTAVPQAVLLPGGHLMHQGAQPHLLRY